MFGPHALDCHVEPKQTSEDVLQSEKKNRAYSFDSSLSASETRKGLSFSKYIDYFMVI